ncbi:hypothetical protein H6G74_27680 [Nostoc spongiaeforme FACHB-130]|uniref:Uncharacterized protein n=1 Tax=Nostoc spongiaeforme FACHB-130 TaxID=1357510 RepID=A0ABR8G4B2_9NOSO|nr:hypothetical protein [Nostoc spongiaeforme]MBD2598076.1 hypothetical protein [Nostoc spongiaeforme FACHB-130]
MLRVYHLFIAVVLLLLMPVGAKFVLPYFAGTKVETKNQAAPASKTATQIAAGETSQPTAGNLWQKVLGKNIVVPSGWQVIPCQGNAPLLCVAAQGEVLGTVEISVAQVSKNPNLQKHLADAGIPLDSKLDYKNSANHSKAITALKAWAGDYYASLSKDRQKSNGNKLIFATHPLEEISISQLPGIRYGFTGIKAEGGLQEQYISYAAFDGNSLYIISTAFDPGAVTGKFEKLENLVIFQPYLSAIAQNLNL